MLFAWIAVAQDRPRVYIEASETGDASPANIEAKHVDFGVAICAAFIKKEVPVTIVTDRSKAQWTIRTVSSQQQVTTTTKTLLIFGSSTTTATKFEGTVQVIDHETSAVLYAYSVKKNNFQSAAEAFAKHFKDDYLKKKK
jgi:hypothetical protein